MKLLDKVWGSLGLFDNHDESDVVEKEAENIETGIKGKKTPPASLGTNVVSLPNSNNNKQQVKMMVVEPLVFDNAQNIADYLKNRKPVVINFENTEKEVAKRMIDFISGTTYALNGTIQKVGNNIFLCAPSNVDVTYTQSLREEDFAGRGATWIPEFSAEIQNKEG